MKTDIQIAQEATLHPIQDIASKLNLSFEDLQLYGRYKAKLPLHLIDKEKAASGKLILVSAISPTPAGEGKTTMSIWAHSRFECNRKKSNGCSSRTFIRSCIWDQGRSDRRRTFTGSSNGRH